MCRRSVPSSAVFARKPVLQTLEQRAAFEEKFSIARRLILAVDIAILATVGYWIGHAIGGSRF